MCTLTGSGLSGPQPWVPLAAALLIAAVASADESHAAAQDSFRVEPVPGGERLYYRIRDRAGALSRLEFILTDQAIADSRRRFQAHRPDELRELARADRERRIGAVLDRLRARYPQVRVHMDADGTVHWAVGPPAGAEQRQLRRFDTVMAAEVASLRRRFPDADIEPTADGYQLQALDQRTLDALERAMAAAADRANAEVATVAHGLQAGMAGESEAVRAEIEAALARIDADMQGFAAAFFHERYYQLVEAPNGDRVFQPDFARLARAAAPDLGGVVVALHEWGPTAGGDAGRRAILDRLLLFVQAIPYDALGDRADSAGFLPPIQLLLENRGDCDSKSVLFAALAHRFFPRLPLALVLLPRHAYVAIGLPPAPGDAGFEHDGLAWTVAEPVGPYPSRVGEFAPDTGADAGRVESVIRLFN